MKLCVALDLPSRAECLNLARELKGLDLWLKVGLRAYLRDGANFIDELRKIGDFKIFLDLKIYDIPNTMADACEVISSVGADMINLHASSGKRAVSDLWLWRFQLLLALMKPNLGQFIMPSFAKPCEI